MHRLKKIVLLFIAVFAVLLTCIYSIGLFAAHQMAISKNICNSSKKIIIISTNDYNKLSKTALSNNVFEIEYQGNEYDVYKTKFVTSKVILWVKKDVFESALILLNTLIFNANDIEKTSNICRCILFNFYFFQQIIRMNFKPNYKNIFASKFQYNAIKYVVFINNISPPPKN